VSETVHIEGLGECKVVEVDQEKWANRDILSRCLFCGGLGFLWMGWFNCGDGNCPPIHFGDNRWRNKGTTWVRAFRLVVSPPPQDGVGHPPPLTRR